MFNDLKKILYFSKMNLLTRKGLLDGRITPFSDDFYEKLSHTYINCLPVSMYIKYLKPIIPPGKCYDRSLYMFFCLDNAILVRGDIKSLELQSGPYDAFHGWIELDNYVYDPTALMRFDKDLYYQIYQPKNITKCNIEEYCQNEDNRKIYNEVKNTTINDFINNNIRKNELLAVIPLVSGIAELSDDEQFKDDLNNYLKQIKYEEINYKNLQLYKNNYLC